MSEAFPRTTRSLRAERAGGLALGVLGAAVVLAGWLGWIALARVPVRATSESARLEAIGEPRLLAAALPGTVRAVHVALGAPVTAGELLVELDDDAARAALADATAARDGLAQQVERLSSTRDALTGAGSLDEEARAAAGRAAEGKLAQTALALRRAEEQAAQVRSLAASGAASAQEVEQADAAAQQLRFEQSIQRQLVSQLGSELGGARQVGQVELGRLEQQLAELRSALGSAEARRDAAELARARHRITAPVDGVVGAIAVREAGAVVEAGDPLVTVVPAGGVRVVAAFRPADALGRIHPGQPARVRLDAFPWTTWGSLAATVERVADEPEPGGATVRVELSIAPGSPIPLRHGLPGAVEVTVDEASPATLLLRAAGG